MKVAIFFLGGALGLILGWALFRCPAKNSIQYKYETSKPIAISVADERFILPPNTPFIADKKLKNLPDVGWWAYTPVLFLDHRAAIRLGISEMKPDQDIRLPINLHAEEFLDEEKALKIPKLMDK